MPDSNTPSPSSYRALGFVDDPFPPIDEKASSAFWMRVLTHSAANSLLAGFVRGAAHGRPVVVCQSSEIPDTYARTALNGFLRTSATDPALSMLALSTTLDAMRQGAIRGPLAELAERVTAMNLPLTVGVYFADMLKDPDLTLPAAAALEDGQLAEAAAAFAADPAAAMERFLGHREADHAQTREEEYDALHGSYLRRVHLGSTTTEDEDAMQDTDEVEDTSSPTDAISAAAPAEAEAAEEPVAVPDDAVRDYLLAVMSADLSTVVARSMATYRDHGENVVGQELRVTKAPRRTLEAILRLMSHRWHTIVFLWEGFEVWPELDQPSRLAVMAALNELRWIFGKYGVMGLSLIPGVAPELDEVFAAAEKAELSFEGFNALYGCDTVAWDAALAQSWIDAASLETPSAVRVDGPELAPIVDAAEGDLLRFALIAEVAFRDAAARGASTVDSAAVAAALASVNVEDGA